jgi:hypothetical protein
VLHPWGYRGLSPSQLTRSPPSRLHPVAPRRPLPRPRRAAPPGDATFPSRRRPAPNGSRRTSSPARSGGPPPGGILRVDPADLLPTRSRVVDLTSASFSEQRRARARVETGAQAARGGAPSVPGARLAPRPAEAPGELHGWRQCELYDRALAPRRRGAARRCDSTTGRIQGSERREEELQPRSAGTDRRQCGSARGGAPAQIAPSLASTPPPPRPTRSTPPPANSPPTPSPPSQGRGKLQDRARRATVAGAARRVAHTAGRLAPLQHGNPLSGVAYLSFCRCARASLPKTVL